MAMPTERVEAVLRARATMLGLKPTESITFCTARAVAGATRRVPLTTCETVETETPASRATSAMVAANAPPWSNRANANSYGAGNIHFRNDCANGFQARDAP